MDKNINDVMMEAYDKLAKYSNELEDRIDKAIEYIKSTKYEWGDLDQDNEDYDIDVNKLLEILKGNDKE